jgi:hypothetical protein
MPLDAAGQVQLDQGDADGADGQAGGPRQLVDIDRGRAECAEHAARISALASVKPALGSIGPPGGSLAPSGGMKSADVG